MSEQGKTVQERMDEMTKEMREQLDKPYKVELDPDPKTFIPQAINTIGSLVALKQTDLPLTYNFTDTNNESILKITPDGEIYWREKKIEVEDELIAGLRDLLKNTRI